jgi:hypothetical protein
MSDAKQLMELEGENSILKRLLAEMHLDIHALRGVLGSKRWPHSPSARQLNNSIVPSVPSCEAIP